MNRAAFFDSIRSHMPGGRLTARQVARIGAVLDGLIKRKLPLTQSAYVLGTAHHETDGWRTLSEYASGAAYEGRADLGNTEPGDGVRFKGRGFVQITGRNNYSAWGRRLRVDLLNHPSLAADLKYAVTILIDGMILGTFTGKKLGDYFTAENSDWLNARRIVNRLDKAHIISWHAKTFLTALQAAAE